MDYLKLPLMDSEVSIFDICQAHQQLEADYNVDGIVRERPSNRRRNESSSCQLHRISYFDPRRHVDIEAEAEDGDDPGDDDVRGIYMINVLQWGLPISPELEAAMRRRFVPEFLLEFDYFKEKQHD